MPSDVKLVPMTRELRDRLYELVMATVSGPALPLADIVGYEVIEAYEAAPADPAGAAAETLAHLANWPVEDSLVYMRLVLAALGVPANPTRSPHEC